jgi:biotin operon repressor
MERQKSRGLFVMDKALNISLFAQVKGELIFDTTLSDGAYRFYTTILYLSGKNGCCWYSQKELAEKMGLKSDRTIRNYIRECEQAGYIRVERRGFHQTNKYYPLVKVIPQNTQVIHDESPTPKDRNLPTGIDRKEGAGKSHAPNNIQHDRAYQPFKEPPTPEKYAKTAAFLAGKSVKWSIR